MLNKLCLVILLTALLITFSRSEGEPMDRMIKVGSHYLHAVIDGAGSPVVVIDGGIGARCEEYRELQAIIAASTTVVIYDRAGYGLSEIGPLPRDSRSEVEELRALLTGLGIADPVILVGHSLGGLNAEVFGGLYSEEVAGMVLLDPPPLGFILGEDFSGLASLASQMTDEWQRIADRGLGSGNDEQRSEAQFFQMLASEHRELFTNSARQATSITSFDQTPLVVIASGVPNPMFGDSAESYQEYWAEQSKKLSARSNRGQYIFAEASSHRLHKDAKDLVVNTVLSMVKSLRASER